LLHGIAEEGQVKAKVDESIKISFEEGGHMLC
jgi:hypothetical protein